MPPRKRASVLVAASRMDADLVLLHYPQYRGHVVLTPDRPVAGFDIDEYIWTPEASDLPASVRMKLRGVMAPLMTALSCEEEFPVTLLSW